MYQEQAGDGDAVGVTPATPDETRAELLDRSRRTFAPIAKLFVQNPDRDADNRSGPLSVFVRNDDFRGLRAFLFLHAITSSGSYGWSTTLPLAVWARAFGATETADPRSASNVATKILTRLEERRLIERRRSGHQRKITVTLLRPDGSGDAYTRPVGAGEDDRFIRLSNRYWADGWHSRLDLPATAMSLVALQERPGFVLAAERVPEWYGWSPDTVQRGFATLEGLGVIKVTKQTVKAPLTAAGITTRNVYTLTDVLKPPRRGKRPPVQANDQPESGEPTDGDQP